MNRWTGRAVGMFRLLPLVAVCVLLCRDPLAALASDGRPPISFDRDVKPILAAKCFACHGPDAERREAGLRLDLRESATAVSESGSRAIVPGDAKSSELWRRIVTDDPDLRMPPPDDPQKLDASQREVLRRWIDEGAPWSGHWAFQPVRRPPLPEVKRADWGINPIDRFVLARLEREGLAPAAPADRRTLIRRVTFDLTGVPPTPHEVAAFLADNGPGAYERVVDRLLASPRFGERFAVPWLDAARYADTNGFFMDNGRDMWAWRDWVVGALNANLPFDEFTVWQIAGDLLPGATREQRIASGFNRNHGLNFEAGALEEECRVGYVVDRVDTTASVWLGLSFGCARCHDHKYDPISQKDYYRFYAYFNNIEEAGVAGHWGNAEPMMALPTAQQQRRLNEIQAECRTLKAQLETTLQAFRQGPGSGEAGEKAGELDVVPIAHYPLDDGSGYEVADQRGRPAEIDGRAHWTSGVRGGGLAFHGDGSIDAGDVLLAESATPWTVSAWMFPAGLDAGVLFAQMDDESEPRGFDVAYTEGRIVVRLIHHRRDRIVVASTETTRFPRSAPLSSLQQRWFHLTVTYDGSMRADGVAIYVDGHPLIVQVLQDTLTGEIAAGVPLRMGRRERGGAFDGVLDDIRVFDQCLQPSQVVKLAALAAGERWHSGNEEEEPSGDLVDTPWRELAFAASDEFARQWNRWTWLCHQRRSIRKQIPTTMVMRERSTPRPTAVLIRGEYDRPGMPVEPGTPECLPPPRPGLPRNRLGLARWLVQPDHPLTARVTMNRAWQMFFGRGIVGTVGEFGARGERPSHPELLDWLAAEFIEGGWDVKAMYRLMVTSATYRQSSVARTAARARDPSNRLFSRMNRRRLTAEMLRDAALVYGNLICWKQGGPGVSPYQPPGLWKENSFRDGYTAQEFVQSHGESLYRRSLYTFWKRTCPPPNMSVFDAPSREFCVLKRDSSATPLQSLVLLNDPTYVEAARALAARVLGEKDKDEERVQQMFRIVLSRPATPSESRVMQTLLAQQRRRYDHRSRDARRLTQVGESSRGKGISLRELAAWTIVASALMNLDESITRN